jgi:hypothetical protein
MSCADTAGGEKKIYARETEELVNEVNFPKKKKLVKHFVDTVLSQKSQYLAVTSLNKDIKTNAKKERKYQPSRECRFKITDKKHSKLQTHAF